MRSGGSWTPPLDLGTWASGATDIQRRSAKAGDGAERDAWRVDVDTVQSTASGAYADAYRYELDLVSAHPDLSPVVKEISVVVSDSSRHGEDAEPPGPFGEARGGDLPVPARSQMVFPHGGEEWCSPTSLSMVMAYWAERTGNPGLDRSVPVVAEGVYDRSYEGWGNWPFNTAYAASMGLEAQVGRLRGLREAEAWVAAGVPIVASVAWDNGERRQELRGAPLPRSGGHLLVIRGFDRFGGVIVNDPAAPEDSGVRRIYDRAEFSRAWLRNRGSSGGIVYLVHPPGRPTPWAETS